MEVFEPDESAVPSVLDVLGVELCARAILDYVPVRELVRSERVCRRWQHIVLQHLQDCHNLSFEAFRYFKHYHVVTVLTKKHRTIRIDNNYRFLSSLCKILAKLGSHITKVITDISDNDDEYLDIIASKCPALQEIEIVLCGDDPPHLHQIKSFRHLKRIAFQKFCRFSEIKTSDQALGELLQGTNYEHISIINNKDLTGSLLRYLNPNSLKSLNLTKCDSLRISDLLSAVYNLRSITILKLNENDTSLLHNIHLLLTEMTQLEDLALSFYGYTDPLSEESIESLSRLVNLKRLDMFGTEGAVNDSLLKALAKGCKQLEYLDIRDSACTVSVRGLAALCNRAPAATTTLHFGFDPGFVADSRLQYYFSRIKPLTVYQELERLGCIELTWQWFEAAYRDPMMRTLPLHTISRGTEAQIDVPQQELKIIMFL